VDIQFDSHLSTREASTQRKIGLPLRTVQELLKLTLAWVVGLLLLLHRLDLSRRRFLGIAATATTTTCYS